MSIYEETISGVLDNTKEKFAEQYNTLWGERDAGSKWNLQLTREMISEWDWQLVHQEGPIRIYQAGLSQLGLVFSINVKALGELTEDERKQVLVKNGKHGPELTMDSGDEVEDIPTNIATLITGPHKDMGDIVYTIHPGNPMPPHNCQTVEELREKLEANMLSPETAVKL